MGEGDAHAYIKRVRRGRRSKLLLYGRALFFITGPVDNNVPFQHAFVPMKRPATIKRRRKITLQAPVMSPSARLSLLSPRKRQAIIRPHSNGRWGEFVLLSVRARRSAWALTRPR